MNDETVKLKPEPGNSGPESWSEPLQAEEVNDVYNLLVKEFGKADS